MIIKVPAALIVLLHVLCIKDNPVQEHMTRGPSVLGNKYGAFPANEHCQWEVQGGLRWWRGPQKATEPAGSSEGLGMWPIYRARDTDEQQLPHV